MLVFEQAYRLLAAIAAGELFERRWRLGKGAMHVAQTQRMLSTRFLLSEDVGKAGEEAFANACRLIQGGEFTVAHRIMTALVSPGPWRVSQRFVFAYDLWRIIYLLSDWLGIPPPSAEATNESATSARQSVAATRLQAPGFAWVSGIDAAQTWTPDELARLVATTSRDAFGREFNEFHARALEVLNQRVENRRPRAAAEKPRDGSSVPADHGLIADSIEQGALRAFPRDAMESVAPAALAAAMLDLFNGDSALAAQRLGRVLAKVASTMDLSYWLSPDYVRLLQTGALAPALGLSRVAVDEYVTAFATRSPFTVQPTKAKPWKVVLKSYVERLKEDGFDADVLLNTLDAGAPDCKSLRARAKKVQILNTPCAEADVAAAEQRLGVALPLSYRDFLLTADGMIVPHVYALLPAAQIDWLRVLDRDTLNGWTEGDTNEASDEEYAVYGADQDCVHMRTRHLHNALQISSNCDGDVLLLIPDVRFGDEWEAWFLGAKNPGAFRFKSFRDLMEQSVLAEDS